MIDDNIIVAVIQIRPNIIVTYELDYHLNLQINYIIFKVK